MLVTSHMDPDGLETEVERWACLGNRAADRAAERARSAFPGGTWTVWQSLAREHYAREKAATVMLTLAARIGATEVSAEGGKERLTKPPPQVVHLDEETLRGIPSPLPDMPAALRDSVGHKWLQWLSEQQARATLPRWVSTAQAAITFMLVTQELPLRSRVENRWWVAATDAETCERVAQWNWTVEITAFSKWLHAVCKHLGLEYKTRLMRPHSGALQFHSTCLLLRIPMSMLNRIDETLSSAGAHSGSRLSQSCGVGIREVRCRSASNGGMLREGRTFRLGSACDSWNEVVLKKKKKQF